MPDEPHSTEPPPWEEDLPERDPDTADIFGAPEPAPEVTPAPAPPEGAAEGQAPGDGAAYTGLHLGKEKTPVRIKCGDRWFDSAAVMMLYARYFTKHVTMLQDATFALHGDGLLQHMQKQGAE